MPYTKHIRSAYALVCRPEDGHILMVRENARAFHKDINPVCAATVWSLPGGKIDDGQHKIDAMIRETKEETGLDVVIKAGQKNPVFEAKRYNPHDGGGVRVDAFVYACDSVGGTLSADGDPDKQVIEAAFVSPEEAMRLLQANPDPSLRDALTEFIVMGGRMLSKKWEYCHQPQAATHNLVRMAPSYKLVA